MRHLGMASQRNYTDASVSDFPDSRGAGDVDSYQAREYGGPALARGHPRIDRHQCGKAVPYGALFTNASVVVGMETVTSPPITRLAWKFLSLKMTAGVTS